MIVKYSDLDFLHKGILQLVHIQYHIKDELVTWPYFYEV